jgi:hypothetical protein
VQIRTGAELAAGIVGRGHLSGVVISPVNGWHGILQEKFGSHF